MVQYTTHHLLNYISAGVQTTHPSNKSLYLLLFGVVFQQPVSIWTWYFFSGVLSYDIVESFITPFYEINFTTICHLYSHSLPSPKWKCKILNSFEKYTLFFTESHSKSFYIFHEVLCGRKISNFFIPQSNMENQPIFLDHIIIAADRVINRPSICYDRVDVVSWNLLYGVCVIRSFCSNQFVHKRNFGL